MRSVQVELQEDSRTMGKTDSISTPTVQGQTGAVTALEIRPPVCLSCGETPISAIRTVCPYCGTALPRVEPATPDLMWVEIGAD